MDDVRVSFVIPTRGSSGQLAGRSVRWIDHAVDGILESTAALQPEIVLVADSDTSHEYAESWRSKLGDRLIIVPTPPPFNFSRKINEGVRRARGDYVLFYNDDVYPISPGWLEKMLEFAAKPEVGAVGAQLLYEDRSIQHAGHAYAHGGVFHFDAGQQVPDDPKSRNRIDRRVSGVTAACLLQRRSVWEQLGGLDESLPNNFNDVDYCARVDRAGYQIIQCNSAQLFHYETQTRQAGAEEWEIRDIERRLGDQMLGDDEYSPDARITVEERRRGLLVRLKNRLRTKAQ